MKTTNERDWDWFFIPADADDGGDCLNLAKRTITLSKANALIRASIEEIKESNFEQLKSEYAELKGISNAIRIENERLYRNIGDLEDEISTLTAEVERLQNHIAEAGIVARTVGDVLTENTRLRQALEVAKEALVEVIGTGTRFYNVTAVMTKAREALGKMEKVVADDDLTARSLRASENLGEG